jgi:hypothetical protein
MEKTLMWYKKAILINDDQLMSELRNNATNSDDIKRNYRMLVKQYHPDVNQDPDSTENITNLTRVYEETVSYVRRFYKMKKDGTPVDSTSFISDWEILGGKASLWLNNSTPLTSNNITQYVIANIKFYKKISLQFSPNGVIDVYRVELEKQRRQGDGREGRFQGTYSFTNELNITQTMNIELGFDENTQKCNYFLVYITRVDIGNTGDISGSVITASSQLTEIWGLSL